MSGIITFMWTERLLRTNLYIINLFLIFINDLEAGIISQIKFFADDTSLNAFDISLENLLRNLEYDTLSVIVWFETNFMKLNDFHMFY